MGSQRVREECLLPEGVTRADLKRRHDEKQRLDEELFASEGLDFMKMFGPRESDEGASREEE
jgi:hypothetical protein